MGNFTPPFIANADAFVTHKNRRRRVCDADENSETRYEHLESLASDSPPEPTFLAKSGPSDSTHRGDFLFLAGGYSQILRHDHHRRMRTRNVGHGLGWLNVGDRGPAGHLRT